MNDPSSLSRADRVSVAVAAQAAMATLDVSAVRLGDVIDAGSARSVVIRALAERRSESPIDVVIKVALGSRDGFVRERAALSLIRDHHLPGAVRLLGSGEDPALVVLEDLRDGPSVADLLLGDDAPAAERAVIDWAIAVGRLQAASTGLRHEFHARLASPVDRVDAPQARRGAAEVPAPPTDLLRDWIRDTAESLEALMQPLGVSPGVPALSELRDLTDAGDLFRPSDEAGLVPGDTCPDNALYLDGQLTLIDFEAAAHRHVALGGRISDRPVADLLVQLDAARRGRPTSAGSMA